MITEIDKQFLKRAMRLAMNGRGHVEPNPMVGCVLVKNAQVIGEGWHVGFGKDHAEPTALNDCKTRGNDPDGATAYVTLEPCCHTNKKTPPCAPRLIEAKIARVVIGCLDPNPDVNGKGVVMLRAAGIEVDCLPGAKPSGSLAPVPGGEGQGEGERTGRIRSASEQHKALTPALSQEERELNASHFQQLIAPFTKLQTIDVPYITMKWAQCMNGMVAGKNGARVRISGTLANEFTRDLRVHTQRVLVGINTVLNDNPMLDGRLPLNVTLIHRYVLDTHFRTPMDSTIASTSVFTNHHVTTTILTSEAAIEGRAGDIARLNEHWIRVVPCDVDNSGRIVLSSAMSAIHKERLTGALLVEPGPTLASSFFETNLCDRLITYRSKSVAIKSGPLAAPIPHTFVEVGTLDLGTDILTEYLNTQSPAYFAPVPSADFVLAQEQAAGA